MNSEFYQSLVRHGDLDKFKADVAQVCMFSTWRNTRQTGERQRLCGECTLSDLKSSLRGGMYAHVTLKHKWRVPRYEPDLLDTLKQIGFTIRQPADKGGYYAFATYVGIGDGWPITLEQFARMHAQNHPELEKAVNGFKLFCAEANLLKSEWEKQFKEWCL